MAKTHFYVARLIRGASFTVQGKRYTPDVAYKVDTSNDEGQKEFDLLKASKQFDLQETDGKHSPTREDDHSGRPGEHYEKPASYGVTTSEVPAGQRDTSGVPTDNDRSLAPVEEDESEEDDDADEGPQRSSKKKANTRSRKR